MTEIAFLVPADFGSGEPLNFPGVPGRWTPGVPIPASDLIAAGAFATVDEARAMLAASGAPIEVVETPSVETPSDDPPAKPARTTRTATPDTPETPSASTPEEA